MVQARAGKRAADAPSLVGRDSELAEIEKAVAAVTRGSSSGLALVGEPGIGKTALVREGIARGEAAGLQAVTGRGTEFEREMPFGVIVYALDGLLGAQEPGWLDGLGAGLRPELARVFPSLAGLSDTSPALQSERWRFHFSVRVALSQLARAHPLMLTIDDAHWADPASVELVAHLLRHGVPDNVLLLLAFRPRQAPELLRRAVGEAARDDIVTLLEVAPLSEREAAELLGGELEARTHQALYRETGGNPFYLIELAPLFRVLAKPRPAVGMDDQFDGGTVPASVQWAIAQELDAASPNARSVVEAAAVVGDPFELELAQLVARLDQQSTLDALDELLAADLVRPTESPERFVFRHPIVRRATYESVGAGSRLAAHRRAADALGTRGGSLTTRAHHVERSAEAGDEQSIALLSEAAHATVQRAPTTAARWFAGALRLLPPDAPQRRLELLIPLATAQGTTGHVEESRATLLEALALIPDEQLVLKARLVGAIARLEHMLARHGDTRAALEDALAKVGPEPSAGSAALRLELAMDYWYADDWKTTIATARAARRDAKEAGDRLVYGTALALEGLVRSYEGELDAARTLVDEAASVIDALPDAELASRIEALVVLGHAEFGGIERAAESRRHAMRGVAISRETGQDTWFVLLMVGTCVANLLLGRLQEAGEAADTAVESSRLGPHQPLVWALTVRGWVDLLKGNHEAAIDHGREALVIAERMPAGLFDWLAHGCFAMTLLEAGYPARARDMILAHLGGPDLDRVDCGWLPHWYETLCLAEIAIGDLDAAERWVARSEAAAEAFPTPGRTGEARYARAALDLASGNPRQAADGALAAGDDFDAADWLLEAGRARILAGRCLAELGEVAVAVELLHGARSTLDSCGALGYCEEAARLLRSLGVRVASPNGHLSPLSNREQQVAELVARGMTNREIADELFVSPKTIESHLSRIFDKLSVPSRAAVAAAITRHASSRLHGS